MKLKLMYHFLQSDLDIIEKALEETIASDHELLQQASMHLLKAGGKRIRPVFVLLAGKFGEYDIDVMKRVAVCLELIHMASLVHDDVIDDAELRRGKKTIKAKWDNRVAMYTGDYIFARSLELLTVVNKPEAHQILSKTVMEVCIGEIEQIRDKFNWEQSYYTYFRRIRRKTALLIAASCQLGAIASDVPKEIHEKLFQFGYNIGMSYQIIDDILDFTGTEEELGKPAGSDLMQGNITLPVLYAIKDPKLKEKIKTVSEHNREEILSDILNSGGIEFAKDISDKYLDKGLRILEELPNNRARRSFHGIAKYIGKRKF